MLKLLVVGIGLGLGVQSLRQWPPDGPVSPDAVALVAVLGFAAAFFAGRAARRAGYGPAAVAVSSSVAEATASGNSVQVFVGSAQLDGSTSGPVSTVRMPTEAAPWMGPAPVLTGDQIADVLEGHDDADLAALLEHEPDGSAAR